MIKRTDLLAKQPPIIPLTAAEEEHAARLYEAGFTYIYKIRKQVFAINDVTGRQRQIQGKDFSKIIKAIDLKALHAGRQAEEKK